MNYSPPSNDLIVCMGWQRKAIFRQETEINPSAWGWESHDPGITALHIINTQRFYNRRADSDNDHAYCIATWIMRQFCPYTCHSHIASPIPYGTLGQLFYVLSLLKKSILVYPKSYFKEGRASNERMYTCTDVRVCMHVLIIVPCFFFYFTLFGGLVQGAQDARVKTNTTLRVLRI